jgi:hypothetical protein
MCTCTGKAHILNNYILITWPYGKCKISYTSVRCTTDKILFAGKRSTIDMSHVDGVDDGIGYGVRGRSDTNDGVRGRSNSGYGVVGYSDSGDGVYGDSRGGIGVRGRSDSGYGVNGCSVRGVGLFGESFSRDGVYAESNSGYAAFLDGNVRITGSLQKAGGSFKIDHPLDPANKYLSHSFVESPDMKNVYDGVVILDYNGEAEIELPDWFGALNKDFRYHYCYWSSWAQSLCCRGNI